MRAGILEEDGKITHPVTGTPQGAIISPVLANIYLHYVLDIWFKQVIKNKSVSKDCRFTPLDSNDLIGRRLWPIIKEMIKTVIENK